MRHPAWWTTESMKAARRSRSCSTAAARWQSGGGVEFRAKREVGRQQHRLDAQRDALIEACRRWPSPGGQKRPGGPVRPGWRGGARPCARRRSSPSWHKRFHRPVAASQVMILARVSLPVATAAVENASATVSILLNRSGLVASTSALLSKLAPPVSSGKAFAG